jgi:hypothetical protein
MLTISPDSSSDVVRDFLVQALKLDLVGPCTHQGEAIGDPEERLPGWINPAAWYLTGFLIPTGTPPEQAVDANEDEELDLVSQTVGDPNESAEEGKAKQKGFFPSSMGLSFLVGPDTRQLAVKVRWGDYTYIGKPKVTAEPEKPADEGEPEGSYWQRTPRAEAVSVTLAGSVEPIYYDVPRSGGLQIHVVERPVEAPGLKLEFPDGTRSVSVFLVNHRPPRETKWDEGYAFQADVEIMATEPLVPRVNLRGALQAGSHPDELISDLHYANSPEYATGHAVSAEWSLIDGACRSICTAWVPTAEVEKTVTAPVPGVELRMEVLGELANAAVVRQALGPLVEEYRAWILRQGEATGGFAGMRRDTAEELVRQAGVAADRLAEGIRTLEEDAQALDAFRVANRAVARAIRQRIGIAEPKWRAFQLAFLLLNLPGVANPTDRNRHTVDLLFFPTGGGKTEAYLGLAAFAMVLRRLRNPGDGHLAGAGTCIVMRYTLRLLTLDQLSRAAGLVCALELERAGKEATYGTWPFEIGLWVGKAATPNQMGAKGDGRSDTARTKVRHFQADPRGKPSPIPLDSCPWCGTKFDGSSFSLQPTDDFPVQLKVVCTNFECDFARRGLPIVAVDEPIYRRLPAFLIATVDKFASLPWVGRSGMILGGAERYDNDGFYGAADPGVGKRLAAPLLPPDLIIQDELHLISGPLGTMVGLYESVIEALCRREVKGRNIGPKIVASTATVRRAQEQIQALFGRGQTQIFPPPGPDRRDSFFAQTVSSDVTPARLYIGIAAQGRSPKVVMRKVWLALMGAAERAYRDAGGDRNENNPVDPYMTVLGYFNALRELGGGRRILEEEVQNTLKAYGARRRIGEERPMFSDRKSFSEVLELTSRVSTDKVSEARTRLGRAFHDRKQRVDCAIATNMISVGLDIPRLGLMVVIGQPKTHSEYIQATSRVGRDDKKPGLVVTLLNIHKPRDRSHYERFRHYHETFYRSVEVSSVTPFSARALDRGFPGVLVGLARHMDRTLTPPKGAAGIRQVRPEVERRLLEIFFERVAHTPFDSEAEREERRRSVQNRIVSLLDEWRRILEDLNHNGVEMQYQRYEAKNMQPLLREMLDTGDEGAPRWDFRANRSMREVEPEVNLFLKDLNGKAIEDVQ